MTLLRALAVALTICIGIAVLSNCERPRAAFQWDLPPWAAPPIVPTDEPMTNEKVALGHYLFYDRRLSGNLTYSCASCHQQRFAFADARATAIGSTGMHHPRRTPTLTNVAYYTVLTWANPLQRKLEKQMLVPMFGEHPVELGLSGKERVLLARLASDERYQQMFREAFPDESAPITVANVTKAIASFERTLISYSSPYDRYRYGHERDAITPAAKQGEKLFFSERLDCFHCHGGVNFSDSTADVRTRLFQHSFHNTGLYNLHGSGNYPADNMGVFEVTRNPNDIGAFKAPTLRNVAVRAPYMHDGSVKNLDAALDHYSAGGRTIGRGPNAGVGRLNPHKDLVIHGFRLSLAQRRDLIAFLQSLTDERFLHDPRFSDPF
jgi:cytochrome c peroxidase